MTGVTMKLGMMIKIALNQEDKMNYEVRRGRMRLLLGAISYMICYYKQMVCSRTVEAFFPLFKMMKDVKELYIEGDELSAEFNFNWQEYAEWVKGVLLSDDYLSKDFSTFDELIDGLNTHLVPVFFCEYCCELYEMNAVYFPNSDLYYCYYRDDVDEDMREDESMDTLRVLNLRGKKEYFHEGDILYTGVFGITYIERTNSIAITFFNSDWFECYSIDRREVNATYRKRFFLGTTARGEEVLLRDSEDGKRLEVVYIDRRGDERYIMDYSCYLCLQDGVFYSNWLYHDEAFRRAYTVGLDGEKTFCSDDEWRTAIWSAMLAGIEVTFVDYLMYGSGVINEILRVTRNMKAPVVFSLRNIESRLLAIDKELCGEEREYRIFDYLREKGITDDEDLFEFFAEAASYFIDKRQGKWLFSDSFVSYLEETDELVERIRTCPYQIFEWSRVELPGEVGRRKCTSLREFFGWEG